MPLTLSRAEHNVSRKDMSDSTVKVLNRLHRSGAKAYLVGGGVRDLLIGRKPKDFDVSTDARPEAVRRTFRNSRIIGRRFRLVHVYFRDGIVEVATFRRDPDPEAQRGGPEDLLITDDNVFGTPREDAFRRDFTVNALFYDIADFSVIDYVGGIEDLQSRIIRVIGDPDVRFREDPVRMLRACELAARLGFSIEPRTQEAIRDHAAEIQRAAPARLTEELVDLLRCGHAGQATQLLLDFKLLDHLIPELHAAMELSSKDLGDFGRVLPEIDRMVNEGRALADGVVLAVALLPAVLLNRHRAESERGRRLSRGALQSLVAETLQPFFSRLALSNQRAERIFQAIMTFHRLGQVRWRPGERQSLARQTSFADALVLFEAVVRATGEGAKLLQTWQSVAETVPQVAETDELRTHRIRRRRRRVARRRRA